MDKRTFLALLALAAAAGSPALAQQARKAEATGDMRHISKEELLRAVYKVSLAKDGAKVGTEALVHLGHNQAEGAQIIETARSIARNARSYENFRSIVEGRAPKGVKLSTQETALIRSVGWSSSGGAQGMRRWEGTSGRTWEGSR